MADTTKKIGSVMVVGAGIAGMQSALDLANAGFKVYLVDEKPAIGGRMAQLDKTFPTNDCAMCTISPKLVECARHFNIDIITYTNVEKIEGGAGNFTVILKKHPRFIREDKCNGCGDCEKECPVEIPNEFNGVLSKRKAIYKLYPQAIPNIYAIDKNLTSPCKATCPARVNVHGYVALISKGKFKEALALERERNPFAAICGRVCHHPCEKECNRGKVDQSIAVADLKRFIADYEYKQVKEGKLTPEIPEPKETRSEKVAVIGAGPSGLTAAKDLSLLGYQVTIFDSSERAGGAATKYIPKYRLPDEPIDYEVDLILKQKGIEFKNNVKIGTDIKFNDLQENFNAVLVAVGMPVSRSLRLPGIDFKGVELVLSFLENANKGIKQNLTGKTIVIIGGGNVAFDAGRTALRLGAKEVIITCLEAKHEMLAHSWEIEEGLEEGIKLYPAMGPKQILGENGVATGLECLKVKSIFDENKRFNPTYYENSETVFKGDMVIVAIGQASDLSFLPDNIEKKPNGTVKVDSVTYETSVKGVFASGDIVKGPASIVDAVAAGHEAAISIDRYVKGEDLAKDRVSEPPVKADVPQREEIQYAPRMKQPHLSSEKRKNNFTEFMLGFTEEMAIAEAKRCLNCAGCSECFECVRTCKAYAPDHSMKETFTDINVGAIILTPGFDEFDAKLKGEYGYGNFENVMTSMQFERILSASGPFQGVVIRPSDGKHPKRIAFIQCVGSRDISCGKEYCSSVCCMYATKEAIIAREHNSSIEATIFYNDIRAHGKGFEYYYETAKNVYNVRYVKSLVSSVKEMQQTKNLKIKYTIDNGEIKEEEFDIVILSIGLVPSDSAIELCKRINVETNKFGFCKTVEQTPNQTNIPGIYVAGAFEAPMDIPDSVLNASSAAGLAASLLASERNTLVKEKIYPPEKDISQEEPRVGVFVCRCGTNIARVVGVPEAVEYAKTLPGVVYAEENLYTCSTDSCEKISEKIKEHNINRFVVASCTPRTHEPLFRDVLREAGINKYLFEMANIRDQCSWVHADYQEAATEKAKDLIRMAVYRAKTLNPLNEIIIDINQAALVIGGGLSGIIATLSLSSQGFKTYLIEKENQLGGNLRKVKYTLEGLDTEKYLNDLLNRLKEDKNVTVYLNAEIVDFGGHVGKYKTKIKAFPDRQEIELEHGVVIVAAGGEEYIPVEYEYGKSNRIVTQLELENVIARSAIDKAILKNEIASPSVRNDTLFGTNGRSFLQDVNTIVMIQCVGSREENHMYCSRVCCSTAVKNALKLKELKPELNIYILYRDIRTYGFKELYYLDARKKGVTFIRFEKEKKPEVRVNNDELDVKVFDLILNDELDLKPDLLVLSTAIRPRSDHDDLATKLKVSCNMDGFYLEAHMKLRPLDFANEGMFICGIGHAPKFIHEAISSAQGAAARAATIISKNRMSIKGEVSVVEPDKCAACLTCVRLCPFHVPYINREGVAYIEVSTCQGCGICVSACPRKAIKLQHYEDHQILAKCEAICP